MNIYLFKHTDKANGEVTTALTMYDDPRFSFERACTILEAKDDEYGAMPVSDIPLDLRIALQV